jgi:hypothetical protein
MEKALGAFGYHTTAGIVFAMIGGLCLGQDVNRSL